MKKGLLALATLCSVTLAFSISTAPVAAHDDDRDRQDKHDDRYLEQRIERGFLIAPVRLKTRGLDEDLVGLGSYIVNTSGCNDCHTNPPFEEHHDPFAGERERINKEGYLGGGTEFGPFVSRNLTPRANGLPAGLTLKQFKEVMKKGTDFKNRHPEISPLLQVMPWPVFGKWLNDDTEAVYEYLRAIPCIGDANRCGT